MKPHASGWGPRPSHRVPKGPPVRLIKNRLFSRQHCISARFGTFQKRRTYMSRHIPKSQKKLVDDKCDKGNQRAKAAPALVGLNFNDKQSWWSQSKEQ